MRSFKLGSKPGDLPAKVRTPAPRCGICKQSGIAKTVARRARPGIGRQIHGVLFRGGAEERIRTKLLKDGHIDTVIGLPANLFYSTGIPVCILVLKRCKKPDDVLFINASGPENFPKVSGRTT